MAIETRNLGPKKVEVRSEIGQPTESDFKVITPENVNDYLNAIRRRIGAKNHTGLTGTKRVQAFN